MGAQDRRTTMSHKDYLNKYFPNGSLGTFEDKPVDLIPHFFDKFGVHVKNEGDVYLFKYDMLAAKFSFPLVKECRGHTWQFKNNQWKRLSAPPDKFFNQSEGYCPIFNNEDFVQKLPSLGARRKEDGSAIQVYWREDVQSWKATTLGTITPGNVGDYPIAFDALFWNTLADRKALFEQHANKEYTYLFEICCVENRIVTKYLNNTAFLLCIRHNEHGTYDDTATFAELIRVPVPDMYFLPGENVTCIEDLKKWVDLHSMDTAETQYREGFVIYDGMTPIAKMKTARYLTLHAVGGGDLGHTRNGVIDAFFTGALDDIMGVLHPTMIEFATNLQTKVTKMTQDVMSAVATLQPETIVTQKDYALWIKANVPSLFHGFFFQNKDLVLTNKKDVPENFTWWLKANYKKYETTWKA